MSAYSLLVLASVMLARAAGKAVNTCAKEGAMPIILDIDPNIDDVLSLAYLAKQGDVELKAVIVTSTGFSNPSAGVDIVYKELEMLGLDIDVGVGPLYPYKCSIFGDDPDDYCTQMKVVNREDHWRIDNLYGIKNERLPYSSDYTEFEAMNGAASKPSTAAEVYKKHVDEGVTFVITNGPYTSLLDFRETYPESFAQIETVYSMAGNVDVLGNVYTLVGNDVTEFNIAADSLAAYEIIANSSIPEIRLTTLDGTNFVPVSREMLDEMATINNLETEFLLDLTEKARDNWFAGPDGFFGELEDGSTTPQSIADGYFLWDPLASVLAVRPELSNWAKEKLTVVTSTPVNLDTDGQFVRSDDGYEVYWTTNLTEVNAEAVRDEIVAVLNKTCISEQPIALASMATVYDKLAFEFGYIEGTTWLPHSCDSDLSTVEEADATYKTCPSGYSCGSSTMRRRLRFGFSDGEVCIKD